MPTDSAARVHLSVAEARTLSERAMRGIGYDAEEARILADHVIDAALCGYEYSGLPKLLNVAEQPRFKAPRRSMRALKETSERRYAELADSMPHLVWTADASGRWRLDLPALEKREPFTVTVRGKNTVTLSDVVTGEVWLNEVNLCPGSFGYFRWEAADPPVRFTALLSLLIEEALARHRESQLPEALHDEQ